MPNYEQDGENFDSIFEPRLTRADVRSEVERTLRDISTFTAQAQAGVTNAIREVKAAHPDFEERRPQMMAVLEQIPLLRDAVASAESNPQLAGALSQIYETVYRAALAPAGSTATSASEPSSVESQGDLSDENTQYRAALASQQVDLSPDRRKELISKLERRGVMDIEF